MFNVNRLLENLTGYIEARSELLRVQAKDGASTALARAVYFFALAFCGLLAFFCLNIALAVLLNHLLDSPFWGYFIMFGLYALLIVVLILNQQRMLGHARFQQIADKIIDSKKTAPPVSAPPHEDQA